MNLDNLTPEDIRACAEKDGKEWARRNADNNGEGVQMLTIIEGSAKYINVIGTIRHDDCRVFVDDLKRNHIHAAFPSVVEAYMKEKNKPADEELLAEAVQLAAMSIRFLMSLDVYQFKEGKQHEQDGTPCGKEGL